MPFKNICPYVIRLHNLISIFFGRKIYVGRKKTKFGLRRQKIGSYYNQEEWLEEFLDDKDAFYDGSESDDSENEHENYTENIEAVVHRCSSK